MSHQTRKLDRRRTLQGVAAASTVAALSGAAPNARAAAEDTSPEATASTTGQSLYDRLGGIFAIAAVVNRFSDEILTNPKLNQNPALKAWNETEAPSRLPGLKFGRTQWIAALTGGPYQYSGLPLHEAHRDFHLTPEEFNEVGAEIVRALDYYQVPKDLQQELVDAYMRAMPDVVDPAAAPTSP